MNDNRNVTKKGCAKKYNRKRRTNPKEKETVVETTSKAVTDGSAGNPNWYFVDKTIAEQVSQLSMRNFAGMDFKLSDNVIAAPSIMTLFLNPSPGVQDNYLNQGRRSGINMASYKMYSRLAMYSGRTQNYAPQDVATLILAFGEIISMVEYVRRAFGVAYTYSERNRSYPRQALNAMGVKADDFMARLSLYRNRFNKLITLINSIPIPKNVAYFDKCAKLYEDIYLDDNTPMAQSIMYCPATTWRLDETSYDQGTILATTNVNIDKSSGAFLGLHIMDYYLDIVEAMVSDMFASSTFNVIYADILNYFAKTNGEAWKFDYLSEAYQVYPQYSEEFKLHFHNCTIISRPYCPITYTGAPEQVITAFNDVVPDIQNNMLIYNPGFYPAWKNAMPSESIVDFPTANPAWEDRLEANRFKAIYPNLDITVEGTTYSIGAMLPDHYIVYGIVWSNSLSDNFSNSMVLSQFTSAVKEADAPLISSIMSRFKDGPYFYYRDATDQFTGNVIGDITFWTTVNRAYLQPIVDFVALDLYDLRS